MGNFVITIIVLIPLFIIIMMQFQRNQKSISDIQAGRRSLDDHEIWLATTTPTEATVVSRSVQISPKARTIAKVDLELKISQPGDGVAVRNTTWLVEVPSLAQIETGRTVSVKVDPKRPERVFPAVPWARAWLFGRTGK